MPKLNMDLVEQVAAQLREQAARRAAGGNGDGNLPELKWYKWRDGDNMLRLVEPAFEDGRLALLWWTHFELPPDRGKWVCLERTFPAAQIPCPICAVIQEYSKANQWDLVKQWTPGGYAYANGVDLYEMDKGVQIIDLRISMYNKLIELMTQRNPLPPYDKMYNDITDMESGHTVYIKKTYKAAQPGRRPQPEYDTRLLPQPTPAHPDPEVRAKWLAQRYQIDKIKKMPNDEGIKAIQLAAQAFRSYLQSRTGSGQVVVPAPVTPAAWVPGSAPVTAGATVPAQPQVTVHPDVVALQAAASPAAPATPAVTVAPPPHQPVPPVPAPAPPPQPPAAPPAPPAPAPPPQPPAAPAASAGKGKREKPACYEKEWREPPHTPGMCLPCPWEVPCSQAVKKKIAAGELA